MNTLAEHFAAGDATDLPGNCKLCAKLIERPGVNLMQDPNGKGTPIDFCSIECLDKALHIFDDLTPNQLKQIRAAIDAVEQSQV